MRVGLYKWELITHVDTALRSGRRALSRRVQRAGAGGRAPGRGAAPPCVAPPQLAAPTGDRSLCSWSYLEDKTIICKQSS